MVGPGGINLGIWYRIKNWFKKKFEKKSTIAHIADPSKGYKIVTLYGTPIMVSDTVPVNEMHLFETHHENGQLIIKKHIIKGGKLKWQKQEPKNGRKTNRI